MDFRKRLECVAFDTTGMNREDFRRYRLKFLPTLEYSDIIRMAAQVSVDYHQDPDGDWFEQLEDEVFTTLTEVEGREPSQRYLSRVVDAICKLSTVIGPGLLQSLDDIVPDHRYLNIVIERGRLLGSGAAVSWSRRR